jgi:apolipoprotein N-acyltransferase
MKQVKWLHDALTGKDNLTYDAARIVGVAGAAAYVAFWGAAVFNLGHFTSTDAAAYGAGLATVMLAMSGAVKLKESAEPRGDEEERR